jgi:hypothetical protein
MQILAGAVFSLASVAAPVWAQSTTTQPARPDRFGGLNERRGRTPVGGTSNASPANAAAPAAMTDEERKEIEAFFQKGAPKRFEKYQDVPEERKQKLLQAVRGQYRMLQRMKEDDPEIYAIRMKRMPIEDEMFSLGWDLRHGDAKDDTRQKLRGKIREFLASKLEERTVRLARLEKRVKDEQAALQRDQGQLEQLVDRGLNAMETERPGELRDLGNGPVFPHRGGGGGGAGAGRSSNEADNDNGGDIPPGNGGAVAAQ